MTTFCIIFGPPFSFTIDYVLHHFWTFCMVFRLHFELFWGYILHWSTVFIHCSLHFALVLDQPFHSFPTTFCIIFGLHFVLCLDYILPYFWTAFCIIFRVLLALIFYFHFISYSKINARCSPNMMQNVVQKQWKL